MLENTKASRAQQSFLIQYLSLILIILSILVGALRAKKPELQVTKESTSFDRMATLDPGFLRSELALEKVFSADGKSIDSTSLEALKQLLENHKIDLHIDILARDGIGNKVVQLARVLREKGFWKNSYSVSGQIDPKATSPKVIARFEWSRA